MTYLLVVLSVVVLLGLVLVYRRLDWTRDEWLKWQEDNADRLSDQLTYQLDLAHRDLLLHISRELGRVQTDVYQQFGDVRAVLDQQLADNRQTSEQRLDKIQAQLAQSLQLVQTSTDKRLNEMRLIVEEKLDQTLHDRLALSFEQVSKQLESVNQGLGEMKTVARDVGTLNKVLSNTKTRGILGELQLGQIIEDMMTPQQYEREFATVSGSTERVEYAIKLPGQARDSTVYLPIDSKFPLDAYYQLEDAYDQGDKALIDHHRKSLLAAVKRFAKDINHKYLNPPETTTFGILFLPTESLYAEIVRQSAFFDRLRREENIVVAGPSTLSALLNALSVGFRTLHLQKNADDISRILGNVKTEFGKYQGMLAKTQKQLTTASKTLDSLLTTRTAAVIKALNQMETGDGALALEQLEVLAEPSPDDK